MEGMLQNGNYQREANANTNAMETRKEVKNPLLARSTIGLTNRYIATLNGATPSRNSNSTVALWLFVLGRLILGNPMGRAPGSPLAGSRGGRGVD